MVINNHHHSNKDEHAQQTTHTRHPLLARVKHQTTQPSLSLSALIQNNIFFSSCRVCFSKIQTVTFKEFLSSPFSGSRRRCWTVARWHDSPARRGGGGSRVDAAFAAAPRSFVVARPPLLTNHHHAPGRRVEKLRDETKRKHSSEPFQTAHTCAETYAKTGGGLTEKKNTRGAEREREERDGVVCVCFFVGVVVIIYHH